MDPAQAAVALAAAYSAEMEARGERYTISVVDLSQLDPLVTATNALGQALADPMGTISGTLTTVAGLVQRYDNKAPHGKPGNITTADTYIDLYDFAGLIAANLGGEPGIVAAANAVKTAIDNYILYEAHASLPNYNLDNSHGVSIFYPAIASSFYNPANYDFAVGADWGGGLGADGPAQSTTWGGFLVDYFQATQPGGPDDPFPPELIAKTFEFFEIFLPVIER
jgi:hypothetical protein